MATVLKPGALSQYMKETLLPKPRKSATPRPRSCTLAVNMVSDSAKGPNKFSIRCELRDPHLRSVLVWRADKKLRHFERLCLALDRVLAVFESPPMRPSKAQLESLIHNHMARRAWKQISVYLEEVLRIEAVQDNLQMLHFLCITRPYVSGEGYHLEEGKVENLHFSCLGQQCTQVPKDSISMPFAHLMRHVDLSHNQLTDIRPLRVFVNLVTLLVPHNRLTNESIASLALVNVYTLWLHDNLITSLKELLEDLLGFPSATHLTLHDNPCCTLYASTAQARSLPDYRSYVHFMLRRTLKELGPAPGPHDRPIERGPHDRPIERESDPATATATGGLIVQTTSGHSANSAGSASGADSVQQPGGTAISMTRTESGGSGSSQSHESTIGEPNANGAGPGQGATDTRRGMHSRDAFTPSDNALYSPRPEALAFHDMVDGSGVKLVVDGRAMRLNVAVDMKLLELSQAIAATVNLPRNRIHIDYRDSESDMVAVLSDSDLDRARAEASRGQRTLKLFVSEVRAGCSVNASPHGSRRGSRNNSVHNSPQPRISPHASTRLSWGPATPSEVSGSFRLSAGDVTDITGGAGGAGGAGGLGMSLTSPANQDDYVHFVQTLWARSEARKQQGRMAPPVAGKLRQALLDQQRRRGAPDPGLRYAAAAVGAVGGGNAGGGAGVGQSDGGKSNVAAAGVVHMGCGNQNGLNGVGGVLHAAAIGSTHNNTAAGGGGIGVVSTRSTVPTNSAVRRDDGSVEPVRRDDGSVEPAVGTLIDVSVPTTNASNPQTNASSAVVDAHVIAHGPMLGQATNTPDVLLEAPKEIQSATARDAVNAYLALVSSIKKPAQPPVAAAAAAAVAVDDAVPASAPAAVAAVGGAVGAVTGSVPTGSVPASLVQSSNSDTPTVATEKLVAVMAALQNLQNAAAHATADGEEGSGDDYDDDDEDYDDDDDDDDFFDDDDDDDDDNDDDSDVDKDEVEGVGVGSHPQANDTVRHDANLVDNPVEHAGQNDKEHHGQNDKASVSSSQGQGGGLSAPAAIAAIDYLAFVAKLQQQQ